MKSVVQKWGSAKQILLFRSCSSAGVILVGLMAADVQYNSQGKILGVWASPSRKESQRGFLFSWFKNAIW